MINPRTGGHYSAYNHLLPSAKILATEISMRGDAVEIIPVEGQRYERVFFSEDKGFAKSYWGESEITFDACQWCGYYNAPYVYVSWQYHIQQLVIQEDYIEYLYSFIKE